MAELYFVTRERWGAAEPREEGKQLPPAVRYVLVTQTDTDECTTEAECIKTVRKLQERDMKKGLPDIAQNFLVGGDGNVYVGRGWGVEPPKNDHYPEFWGISIEVAHIEKRGEVPSTLRADLVNQLVGMGSKTGLLHKYTGLFPVMD